MSYQVELGWKIFSSLSPQAAEKTQRSSALFNIKGTSSFLRTLGGNPRAPYVPVTLEPTKNLHNALLQTKSALGIDGKQFTFTVLFDQLQQRLQVTVGLRKYLSCVCASVKVQAFSVECLSDVFKLQNIKSHKRLFKFVSEILAITTSGVIHTKKLSAPPKVFPVVKIKSLGANADDTVHRLVEILTRHSIEELDIIGLVVRKNKIHQIDKTLVLIDRQGVLSYLPPGCSSHEIDGNLQRFKNASSLLEFAVAIKRDLKAGFISPELIVRIVRDPKYFLPDSISAQKMWGVLMDELSIYFDLERVGELIFPSGSGYAETCGVDFFRNKQVLVQQFFSSEISMGDQYRISGQVGAVGPKAKAENNLFRQVLQKEEPELDLVALAAELAILRNSMRPQATEVEHDQAIAYIGAAENAAKVLDVQKTLIYLKSAGDWALDVAAKSGLNNAARAIKLAVSF